MASYQALARKWRPQRFDQLVGQPHVVQALQSALTQEKIHHAYLFTGTHGIGKTSIARIFAKCLNCESGITATPCEKCANCEAINAGRFPDLFEIDAASRTKVEDTRELLDNIPYAPTQGRMKVYLIDEVHMLSGHSFNALLKTLEEPPAHVKFLLATTDPQKLPATVLSRCLQFHLSKITPEQIEAQLQFIVDAEKISAESNAIKLISEFSNGSMRDSLSLLDQCIAYGNGKIKTIEVQSLLGLSNQADIVALIQAIHASDAQTALTLTKKWAENGVNFSRCLTEMITRLYQISLMQLLGKNAASNPALKQCAETLSAENTQLYYQIALMGQRDLPLAPTAQMGFEMVVIRMMSFQPASDTPTISTAKKSNPVIVEKKTSGDIVWHELLGSLGLTGATLALAQHCSMHSFSNNFLQLKLQPKYTAFNNAKQQQRIQESVSQTVGYPVKVTITVEENDKETPADHAKHQADANMQSAKEKITKDATVERIVKTFDATLLQESIEPIN